MQTHKLDHANVDLVYAIRMQVAVITSQCDEEFSLNPVHVDQDRAVSIQMQSYYSRPNDVGTAHQHYIDVQHLQPPVVRCATEGIRSLDYLTAVLRNKQLSEWLRIHKQDPASLRRTILMCEGLAVNFLFDHGSWLMRYGPVNL